MQRRPFLRALTMALAVATVGAPLLAARAASDGAAPALVAQLRGGGNIILMRHAATVAGIGDPAGFVLTECATQRNLSSAGRLDAARIGAAFVRLGVPVGAVLSSRWCRCLDTARLAFGKVAPAPQLDSMFNDDDVLKARRLREAQAWLAALPATGTAAGTGAANIVLVTHDVNIYALAGVSVRQGEMVVGRLDQHGVLQVSGVWSL